MRRIALGLTVTVWILGASLWVRADSLTILPGAPSTITGPAVCKPGFSPPQCTAVPYDTSGNFAFSGNGSASPAVALNNIADTFPYLSPIHLPQYANDGFYGNGSSWISNSTNSWVMVDLGQVALVNALLFGRDRTGGFDDRGPGQFTIAVSLDGVNFITIFNSADFGFSGLIFGAQTLQADFTPVQAQYIKITVQNSGAAIDEIELRGTVVPEPGTLLLLGTGLAGLWLKRRTN